MLVHRTDAKMEIYGHRFLPVSVQTRSLLIKFAWHTARCSCPAQMLLMKDFESRLNHYISLAVARIIHSFDHSCFCSFMHHMQAHGPFLYIYTVGTHPEQQSLGLGSRVLKEVTSIADEHGQHCYLEVSLWGTILHGKR